MKRLTIFLMLLMATTVGFSQNNPIDFETDGNGANWTWTVFENGANPAVEIVANPDQSGINTSATVAKFTALQAGQPWAGTESAHGSADLGPFVLDATNSTIKIMVWKTVVSDVGIKLASSTGWAQVEIKVPNTKVNEWEELVFDFSGRLNPPAEEGILDQIIIFPDFDLGGRTQDNIVYFDNITFSASGSGGEMTAAPTPPARDAADVLSVFSGAYINVAGTNFNPNWGQSTQVTFEDIGGNETMKYANFNYQGTQFASGLDVSGMETLHLDMWTGDATAVNVFLISPGPAETAFSLPIQANQWVSYEIPLTAFTAVNLADVIQFKFDGGNGSQTIYLDNIYFSKADGGGGEPSTLGPIDFETDGNGANWTWTVFENGANPAVEIVANPDQSGINTSATVAKFTALQAGQPWAGTESAHGSADLGPFVLDATNSTIKIMVWKTVVSDVGIKLASSTGWAQVEIKVPNTKVNEWEELVFDFSGRLNPPAEEGILDQIIIFPDFDLGGRTQDNIVYFDNITFNPAGEPDDDTGEPTDGVKLPITFEDTSFDWTSAITNFDGGVITVIDNPDQSSFNNSPRVGQMVKNAGQVWGGGYIDLGENLNLATYPKISVSVWAPKANSTLLLKIENSAAPAQNFERNLTIPIDGQWTDLEFDMSGANLANPYDRVVLIFDLGTAGDGGPNFTWFFDNIRYTALSTDIEQILTDLPTAVQLNQNYPNPFNPTTQIQFSLPSAENVRLDVFNTVGQLVATVASGSYAAGEHTVNFDASALSSGLYVYRLQTGSLTLTKKMTLVK
jgi:hypothetical protein